MGILQVVILIVIFQIGNQITKYTHIPIPGSIIGLVLLFLLLQFKIVKMKWIERGANWLLADLLLFFIPSAVGVINYQQAIGSMWGKLFLVIVLSTLTVMAFTGLTAQIIAKHRKGDMRGPAVKNR